jgi:hypothetical protein
MYRTGTFENMTPEITCPCAIGKLIEMHGEYKGNCMKQCKAVG